MGRGLPPGLTVPEDPDGKPKNADPEVGRPFGS